MKKSLFFLSAVAIALLTASCNKSLPEELDLKMNPNPMTVVGGQVNVEVTGTFPPKKFLKNALVNVTPVLKYGENEEQEVLAVHQSLHILCTAEEQNECTHEECGVEECRAEAGDEAGCTETDLL